MKRLEELYGKAISTHALREEGDGRRKCQGPCPAKFLPTPSARRATCRGGCPAAAYRISTHALREEGDKVPFGYIAITHFISTHALREEGDACRPITRPRPCGFLPTPSARRATRDHQTGRAKGGEDFYPRPPRGGRRGRGIKVCDEWKISTHALREEGDQRFGRLVVLGPAISTHALREEGDKFPQLRSAKSSYFYPRPPRGGRHGPL